MNAQQYRTADRYLALAVIASGYFVSDVVRFLAPPHPTALFIMAGSVIEVTTLMRILLRESSDYLVTVGARNVNTSLAETSKAYTRLMRTAFFVGALNGVAPTIQDPTQFGLASMFFAVGVAVTWFYWKVLMSDHQALFQVSRDR